MEHKKGGKDLPFKVVDNRRFAAYKQNDGEEAFRTASFGGDNKPPESAARYAAPDRSGTGLPRDEPYAGGAGHTSESHAAGEAKEKYELGKSKFLALASGAVIVVGGLILGSMNNAGNYTARNAGNSGQSYTQQHSQPQQAQAEIYRAEQMPSAPEIAINVEAFNRYQGHYEEKYNEFARSPQVHMREVPIPHGISYTGDGINWPKAFEFDINGDGVEEIYMPKGCTSNAGAGGRDCRGYIYQNSGSGYVEILDGPIDRISVSDRTANGYPVAFVTRKLAGTDVECEHLWNGQKYMESGRFVTPENLPVVVKNIQTAFEEQNPQGISNYLRQLQESIGTYGAMRAFLQFQAPPGFTVPTGSEYVEYVRAYASEVARTNPELAERILNRYADDPDSFFAALYGRSLDPVFLRFSSPKSLAAVSLMMTARGFSKGDWQRHLEFWDRAQNRIGFLAAYKDAAGAYPRNEAELWSAQNNVIREDRLRTIQSPDTSIYRRSESPYGATESREFNPTQVQGDHRLLSSRPMTGNQQQQERARQMDQATQQGVERGRQMFNQGINKAGEALKNILPKDPNKKQ